MAVPRILIVILAVAAAVACGRGRPQSSCRSEKLDAAAQQIMRSREGWQPTSGRRWDPSVDAAVAIFDACGSAMPFNVRWSIDRLTTHTEIDAGSSPTAVVSEGPLAARSAGHEQYHGASNPNPWVPQDPHLCPDMRAAFEPIGAMPIEDRAGHVYETCGPRLRALVSREELTGAPLALMWVLDIQGWLAGHGASESTARALASAFKPNTDRKVFPSFGQPAWPQMPTASRGAPFDTPSLVVFVDAGGDISVGGKRVGNLDEGAGLVDLPDLVREAVTEQRRGRDVVLALPAATRWRLVEPWMRPLEDSAGHIWLAALGPDVDDPWVLVPPPPAENRAALGPDESVQTVIAAATR